MHDTLPLPPCGIIGKIVPGALSCRDELEATTRLHKRFRILTRDMKENDGLVTPKICAVNCKLFWEMQCLRYAATISGSETIIFFMQLHLPIFPGVLFIRICSFQNVGSYLFHAAAALELVRINFA